MQISTAARVATPLATIHGIAVAPGQEPARLAVTLGAKSVAATGPLEHALQYAGHLVRAGYASSMGVLQAAEGWTLVALESNGAPLGIEAASAAKLQRHTYDLAAIVSDKQAAVWTGKQRISHLRAL
jgi:hypothetical protein